MRKRNRGDQIPVTGRGLGDNDQHHRRRRQIRFKVDENLLKRRYDLDHDEGQNTDGHRNHDDRIDHRPFDFPLEVFGLFHEVGQTLQDDFQGTTRLTGLDHVDVQPIKRLGGLAHRFGQRRAAFDLLAGVHQRVLQPARFGLLFQNPQASQNRQTGVLQNGQLPREHRQIATADAADGKAPFLAVLA